MALPGVKLELENGQIPNSVQTQDGIAAMILTGQSVTDGIQIGQPQRFKSLVQAERLGISEEANKFAHEQLKKFYKYTGIGATLRVLLVDKKEQACDANASYVQALEAASKRTINLLAVSTVCNSSETARKAGLDPDVDKAAEKAQALCEYCSLHHQHFLVTLDGKGFEGDPEDLKDYKQDHKNRVCIFLCNDNGARNANIGTLLGRASGIPVTAKHRTGQGREPSQRTHVFYQW